MVKSEISKIIYKYDNEYKHLNINDVNPWYLVRHLIVSELTSIKQNTTKAHTTFIPTSIWLYIKYFFHVFLTNPFFSFKKAKIMIFSSGVVNIKVGSMTINRLYDLYVKKDPNNITLIERSNNYGFAKNRVTKNIKNWDYTVIIITLFGRIFRNKQNISEEIRKYVLVLQADFSQFSIEFWVKLKNYLIRFYIKKRFGLWVYKKLLKKYGVKQVFIEDASYGGASLIILACRDLNIKVSEIQHGMISLNHLAYNWNEEFYLIRNNRKLFVDQLLIFGEYYKNKISLPSDLVNIGSPFLNKISGKKINVVKKRVLILSQGTVSELFNSAIEILSNKISSEFEILHKAHPGEYADIKERYKYQRINNHKIEYTTENVYDLIKSSEIIISCYSTALYESILFEKKIIVLYHPLAEENIDLDLFTVCYKLIQLPNIIHSLQEDDQIENMNRSDLWQNDSEKIWCDLINKV